MPAVNDTLPYRTAAPSDIDVSITGADMIWDHSALSHLEEDADLMVPVASTPLAYQFYFNNPILYPEHDADHAMQGMDLSFQVLTVENVYDYYKNGPAGYRNVGFGANVNGVPMSIRRQPVDRIYTFPLQSGDVDSSFSAWEVDIPNMFFFRQEQWRKDTVDGWGTLILPSGTYETIRVRTELERYDSIYIAQLSNGFSINEPLVTEYKWLAPGIGRPALVVTTVDGALVSVQYHHEDMSTTVQAHSHAGGAVFPVPAQDLLRVRPPYGMHGLMRIRDQQGKILGGSQMINGSDVITIDISGIPDGIYFLELEGESSWSKRFSVIR